MPEPAVRRRARVAAWSLALAAAALPSAANASAAMNPSQQVPPARDGDVAIRQELCAARKADTVEAYDLFIARHSGHPLAEEARKHRARLIAKNGA
jgi:hypothetical protein